MSEETKCETCGGEGLISQGESIKFTCSACSGTGKAVEAIMAGEDTSSLPEEPVIDEVVPEESFSVESGEAGVEALAPEGEVEPALAE